MPKTTQLEWIERYDVPSVTTDAGWFEGWATIHIDSRGFLGIVSDFGNYAFYWQDFGCDGDFKKFLTQLDWDYLHGKLLFGRGERYVYDADETRKAIRVAIDSQSDVDVADEYDRLEDHDLYEDEGFAEWTQESRLDDPWNCRRTMHEPQCRRFCQETWPRFLELLKAGGCSPILPRHDPVPIARRPAAGG